MKTIIAGGRGHVGAVLLRVFAAKGIETVVLSRSTRPIKNASRVVKWDGETLGAWRHEIDGPMLWSTSLVDQWTVATMRRTSPKC